MTDATPDRYPLTIPDLACFALYSAHHAFNRVYKPLLDPLGLTYPQYLVMVALWEGDDQTVGQLGQRLGLESSTLTPLLKRLEAIGHVSRQRDPQDERQVRIRLTGQGRQLQQQAMIIPSCIMEASGMTVAELSALRQTLGRLQAALERSAQD